MTSSSTTKCVQTCARLRTKVLRCIAVMRMHTLMHRMHALMHRHVVAHADTRCWCRSFLGGPVSALKSDTGSQFVALPFPGFGDALCVKQAVFARARAFETPASRPASPVISLYSSFTRTPRPLTPEVWSGIPAAHTCNHACIRTLHAWAHV